jgi:manganese-dependent inorganic pyrophosphatase
MEEPYTVLEDELVKEIRRDLLTRRTAVITDTQGRLKGIITRSDLVAEPRKKVALVDHNEFSQSLDGVWEAEIVAVIDHHRLSGDIESYKPILFVVEPLGSTSSIIWRLYRLHGIYPPKNLALAMLYAIYSDTLLLKSPTTTDVDRRIVEEIISYTGIRQEDAVKFMVEALSLNEPRDLLQAIVMDMKIFEYKGYSFAVSQVFTVNPEWYLERLNKLKEYMRDVLREKQVRSLMLLITNYVKGDSILIAEGDTRLVEKALEIDLTKGWSVLKGVTSRKAQVVPKILSYLRERIS